jgi:amino acid transporter
MSAVSVLAEEPKNTGPDFGKASPVGLLIVVLLLIGVFVLVWSMNRHLKKLPASFDTEPPGSSQIAGGDDVVAVIDAEKNASTGTDPEKPPREPGG